ncbi:MAG TPA: VanZ family protein [Ramlibacter sp.]|nr:VanZ family protein [Ramlibacter sp.]
MPSTGWDKVNHALAFAVLAIQGCLCWRAHAPRVLSGLLAYGALIEALQSLTPARSAEWLDLLADMVGLGLGWMALRLIAARRAPQRAQRQKPHSYRR